MHSNFTEEVYSTSWHYFGRCFDHRCCTNWSSGFNGWGADHGVHHFANQFSCFIAEQLQFAANNRPSCLCTNSGSYRHFRLKTTFHHSQWWVRLQCVDYRITKIWPLSLRMIHTKNILRIYRQIIESEA